MDNDNPESTDSVEEAVDKLADTAGLEKSSKLDIVRNSVIAAISAIPLVGGPLASLAEDFIPSQKEKRLLAFIEQLSQEITAIKDSITADVVNTDGFAFIFEKTLKGVLDNWQQDKIDCYKAIFLNALTGKDDLTDEEQELFIQLLDSLTVRHIKIMAFIYQQNLGITPPKVLELRPPTGQFLEVLQRQYPEYDKDSAYYIMQDLRNKGLVNERGEIADDSMSGSSNQLSVMGKKFVSFITL